MSHYLISGGTGFIGRHYVQTLLNQGHQITVLSRQKHSWPGVTMIDDLNMLDEHTVIDVIINLAGKPIDCRWSPAAKQALLHSRLSVTTAIVDLIRRLHTKPACLISASAIGYYGDQSIDIPHEDIPPQPSFTADLCQRWENKAIEAADSVRVCCLRLGVVLGAHGGFIKKTYWPFYCGLGGRMGDGQQPFSWVHIDDVLSAINWLITHPECQGAYNVVAPQAISQSQLTAAMGKVLHRPTLATLPAFVVKILFGEMGEKLLLSGQHITPYKLLQSGFEFQYTDIEMALQQIYIR